MSHLFLQKKSNIKKKSSSESNTSSNSNNSLPYSKPNNPSLTYSNRREYILYLQRTIGNRAVERLWKSGVLQKRLGLSLQGHDQNGMKDQNQLTENVTSNISRNYIQRRNPDASKNGYQSFYIDKLIPGDGTEVRVQFFRAPNNPEEVTFSVWYEETNSLQQVTFKHNGELYPHILMESKGLITFDLDNDGTANIILNVSPNTKTHGVDFFASYQGQRFFSMQSVPKQKMPKQTDTRGIPMGNLPDGRPYFLVPYTSHLVGGPRFIDDRGQIVNPGLEYQAKEIQKAAAKGYLIGMAILLGIAGAYALVGTSVVAGGIEAISATASRQVLINILKQAGIKFTENAVVGITRTVLGRIVWLEVGTGSAGLTHIMNKHGVQFATWGLRTSQAVSQFLIQTVRTLTPVATHSGGAFDFIVKINGVERLLRIVIGSNGFIVTAHPL